VSGSSLRRAAVAPFTVARRRLRSDPLFAAVLFIATTATAFLFALAPQLFERMAASSLEQTVARATPLERNLAIAGAGRIDAAPGDDPTASVVETGKSFEAELPASVRAVVGEGTGAAETVRTTIVTPPGETAPPGTTRYLTLRHAEDAAAHLRAAEGRLPGDEAEPVETPFPGRPVAVGLDIALSATTAEQLGLELGDRVYVLPAPDDPLVREVAVSDRHYLALDVTGIVDVAEGDEAWLRDSRLGKAAVRDTDTMRFVYGYALVAGEAYNELLAGVDPLPLRYEWRYPADPDAVASSDVAELAAGLRQVDAAFGESTFGQRLGFGVQTGLGRILARHEADREATGTVLAVAGISLLAVALTVLGALAALAAERRSESIALLRSRGGSLTQTLAAQAAEGLLVALPAGVLGYALATVAAGRPPGLLPALLVLAVVVLVALLLAGGAVDPARRALAARGRPEPAVPSLSPARLAVEALVIVASLVGAYLLRRRGLSATEGVDPLLAAVPVLVGLAVALIVLRLYPYPLQGLAWASASRRDLVPTLGLRRLARQPSLAAAPFVVALLATSSGAFTAALATTIANAQERAPASDLTSLNTDALSVFQAGIVVAGAYAALALVLAPALTARSRVRDVAYLRALGLPQGDVRRLAVLELAPPVGAALVLGILLGVGTAYLVEPGLDLGALAAGAPVEFRPAVVSPLLLIAALVLVTVAVIVLVAAAAGRVRLSRVLRMGER
jgi:putative ABC transport system permease protein